MSDTEDWDFDGDIDFGEPDTNPFDEIETLASLSPIIDQEDDGSDDYDEREYEEVAQADVNEHMLLEYLTSNQHLWTNASTIIDDSFFEREYRPVIPFVTNFVETYGKLPPKKIIHAETGVRLVTPDDCNDDDILEYVSGRFEEHCRNQAMAQLIVDASDSIGQDDSTSLMAGFVSRATDIANMSLMRDLGIEVLTSAKSILSNAEMFDEIPTGFGFLDLVFDGGISKPSFNMFSGSSGDGKSIMLQNVAVKASKRGINSVFYTLELEPSIVMKRFAAMLTNTGMDTVYRQLDAVHHTMKRQSKTQGKIWLKKFPMTKTTMADIAAHYNDLVADSEEEWPVVCIDYIDVLLPIEKVDLSNIHIRDDFISKEMNQFFHANNIMGWTAAQQTKGAKEEKDSRTGAVAGGKDKVSIADTVIALRRTDEDMEDEQVWWNMVKVRSGAALGMKLPMSWDGATQYVGDGDYDLLLEANPRLAYKLGKQSGGVDKTTRQPNIRNKKQKTRPTEAEATAHEMSGKSARDKITEQLNNRFGK